MQALRDVSVDCRAGEIHALVGENGSGKSTLLGIASGFVAADEGVVEIGGRRTRRGSPRRGAETRSRDRVSDVLARPRPVRRGEPLAGRTRGRATGPAGRRRMGGGAARGVQARRSRNGARGLAVARRAAVPRGREGAACAAEGAPARRADDRARAGRGRAAPRARARAEREAGIGIVYVSHRLPEVLGIADRVTVLRDGVCQGTFEAAVHVGGEPGRADDRAAARARRSRSGAPRASSARRCSPCPGCAAIASARSTSKSRAGEIVGIAGAEGNGQVPFLRALAGVEHSTGSASCDGQRARHALAARPAARRSRAAQRRPRARVALPGAERARQHDDPGAAAASAASASCSRRRERDTVDGLAQRLSIRMASIEQPVQSLSGGNQQKVSLTRPFLRGTSR